MAFHTIKTNSIKLLKFEGELLAKSTSKIDGKPRWIEFALYKTYGGTYVLSRVGMTSVYHAPTCSLVKKYGLDEGEIDENSTPCIYCKNEPKPVYYVEEPRWWHTTSDNALDLIDKLYKYDEKDNPYLTNVAQDLLADASEVDPDIERLMKEEWVD